MADIDLKAAINAISDVVQNRPRPLREIDQIYMKTGDMVLQSEMIARWADNKKLAFMGDGDAISVCIAYLKRRGIFSYGPSEIVVFDFDERICGAVTRFAESEGIDHLSARLYNCLDAFPEPGAFDAFYTNPPWGQSNDGESVKVFVQRGIESTGHQGEGVIVIADDHSLEWPQNVLAATQLFALHNGFYVQRMSSQVHQYHLDDNPDLKSCNLYIKALPSKTRNIATAKISDPARLSNFYGRNKLPHIKYIRERKRVDYGKANDDEYFQEAWEENP